MKRYKECARCKWIVEDKDFATFRAWIDTWSWNRPSNVCTSCAAQLTQEILEKGYTNEEIAPKKSLNEKN